MNHELGRDYLASKGIKLLHVFDTSTLEDLLSPAIDAETLSEYPSTVLTAHAGADFWHALSEFGHVGDHPVDHFSIHLTDKYVTEYLNVEHMLLYPSEYAISLRSVAQRTGWCHPSPLGVTIHHEFGLWFAFRSLFMVKTHLPASDSSPTEPPCESCADKPCISACPSNAVGEIGKFQLEPCARYRLQESSPCSFSCLSRIRCPVGSDYRYVSKQMKYHYQRSRNTIAHYYGM